ncbi:hypothetical protein ABEF95_011913 [Exophiala dermatitidis]
MPPKRKTATGRKTKKSSAASNPPLRRNASSSDVDMDASSDSMMESGSESGNGNGLDHKSMAVDAKQRKAQKQQRLEEDFESKARAIKDQLDGLAENHRQKCMQTHDGQLAQLLSLAQKKANIERQIKEQAEELAHAYETMREEFRAVLQGMVGDVDESIKALNALEERARQS